MNPEPGEKERIRERIKWLRQRIASGEACDLEEHKARMEIRRLGKRLNAIRRMRR